jgi:hypothetical protein
MQVGINVQAPIGDGPAGAPEVWMETFASLAGEVLP